MVTTLIKHEVRRTRGFLLIAFGVATLLTLVGWLMAYTPWETIQVLGLVLMFATASVFATVVQLGLAFDYWRSSYKKTGYFTQSLPIKGSTIYGSKLLWGSLIMVLGSIWSVVLMVPAILATLNFTGDSIPPGGIRQVLSVLGAAAPGWVWMVMVLLFIITIAATLAMYYFAVSLGSEAWINKLGIGGPLIMVFAVYTAMQVLLFAGIFLVPLGLTGTMDGGLTLQSSNFVGMFLEGDDGDVVPIGWLPVLLVATAVMVWRTVVSWNKKVSLV